MKKILISYLGRKGGGEKYSYEMAKQLINSSFEVHIILSTKIDNKEKWKSLKANILFIETYDNKFSYIINTILLKFMGLYKIKKHYNNICFDYIYIPMIQPWTNIVNSAIKHKNIITTLHDPIPHSGTNKIISKIVKNSVRQADEVILLSKEFFEFTRLNYNIGAEKIHVIPHGLFNYEINDGEKLVNYSSKNINFLFFGRISKYKGLDILADAYKLLQDTYANVSLTIAGNGDFLPYKDRFSNLKSVTLINRWIKDEEVAQLFYGEKVITVLPYIDATQSGIIPIAMKNRSLVLASNAGGLSEQVKDRVTGFLFEANNVNELFKAMKNVVDNYNTFEFIIDNAEIYVNELSWEKLALKLIDIMQK